MSKHADYERRRVLYIGPLGVSLVTLFAAGASLFVVQTAESVSRNQDFEWEVVLWGTAGAFLAALFTTWVFNIVAPILGGVRVWLRAEPPPPAVAEGSKVATEQGTEHDFMKAGPGTKDKKRCPACETLVRGDRSFCPDCGHDFE